MRKHRDLTAVLRSHHLRITPGRRALLQFVLDNASRRPSLGEIQAFLGVDRSSVYRNLVLFRKLGILQELNLPRAGRRYEYVLDRKVNPFFICKSCGSSSRSNSRLLRRIEKALSAVPGFASSRFSAIFYGYCPRCSTKGQR